MANIAACMSSKKMDWETPWEIVVKAEAMIGNLFDLDVAATEKNRKAPLWYGAEYADGLTTDWSRDTACSMFRLGHDAPIMDPGNEWWVWCNPPYGREIGAWVEKAANEAAAGRASVVMLLPVRSDTKYWQSYIQAEGQTTPYPGVAVNYLSGRIKFVGAPAGAPFPSALVTFR